MRLMYIWQRPDWPSFRFDSTAALPELADAHRALGELEGQAHAIGMDAANQVTLDAFSKEVVATAAIEGEALAAEVVRSSVMRRLGLSDEGVADRHVDGLVDIVNDAVTALDQPLDEDRLCRWQSALFPGGTSGIVRIAVGRYRDHEDPMQIVSGRPGREVVHYQAPPSHAVRAEMERFLAWFADTTPSRPTASDRVATPLDGLARAAIAHLWFESIHPFEDGNGRLGRAVMDLALAQHQGGSVRLYSLSGQLLASRKAYYDQLNQAQRGDLDVTAWIRWLVQQFAAACRHATGVIRSALVKRAFWDQHAHQMTQERQRKVVQRLLDDGDGGFQGGLNADKYMKMTGTSKATATRDLMALVAAGVLRSSGAGRAVRYYVNVPGWTHGIDQSSTAPPADSSAQSSS